MKKKLGLLLVGLSVAVLAACGEANDVDETNEPAGDEEEQTSDVVDGETIVFGLTTWTSTEAPTNIAKLILEEAGYEVEFSMLDQPVIFEGLVNEDVHFFMDAWLPYTEAELWSRYEDDLQKVATSYSDVPLGWVVPAYVEEDSIEDLVGNADKYDGRVVSIDPGAGIVTLSEELIAEYGIGDEYTLTTSSEFAMMAEAEERIAAEEPVIFTGWRPHSMFAKFDLKFLEDEKEIFKSDDVYVISYNGIEDEYTRAYEILSNWSIEVADLEEMMLKYEEDDVPFEESAKQWIEDNRDQVDEMLGN
ncbi:glycine betaine ABC transporter substrate-binding protein [Bacillus shivajii]|uniref:glycine betaine ABC transporter substrate-binding protein n=1 Tax=Bacillus shivajii TaxID=1983719 RepID=UPI001CFA9A8E|nr:glycine betaine ABC transporter substrate-binding protein [Bacillus shivajii]UCZ52440.1 glycine betaine ABC transporter substrate-binding protein [Bacillus shivajii]